jgi:hypothetical protein
VKPGVTLREAGRSIRAASFARAATSAASMSGLSERLCSCHCLGRPSVRSSTSLTARKATRSSSELIRRSRRASARSRSSGSAAVESSSSAPSCSLSALRLRIFSARAWPPRARSSGVKAWAGAPFLSRRDALEPGRWPPGSSRLCALDCMPSHRRCVLWTVLWKNRSPQPRERIAARCRSRVVPVWSRAPKCWQRR